MDDDYPTQDVLDKIENWSYCDTGGLVDYLRVHWHWPEFVKLEGKTLTLITGGWSGNEDIIGALKRNYIVWLLYWYSSNRGGKHLFDLGSVEEE